MKAILTSDWHLVDRPIFSRKDDPYETQFNKLHFIFEYANKNDIEYIFQAGDMFDKPRSYNLLEDMIKFLRFYKKTLYCVAGQHDMIFRNIKKTNISILEQSNFLRIVSNKNPTWINDIFIYGQSWGENIPVVRKKDQKNLLITHSPIALKKNHPNHGLINFSELKDFGFVLCGDIHKEFFQDNILNTGPMLRKSIVLKNHTPCFYVLDWNKKNPTVKRIEIPHETDIFQEKIESQSLDKQGFDDFVEEMRKQNGEKSNFYDILKEMIEDEIPAVQKIIDDLEGE